MTGKMLGRLANHGTRCCGCCDYSRGKRQWKRDERKQWEREQTSDTDA